MPNTSASHSSSRVRRLDIEEYTRLFNERCFNPPGKRTDENETTFEAEFGQALDTVEAFFNDQFSSISSDEESTFFIWPNYNWSRVLSVELTTYIFLDEPFIRKLQSVLRSLPEAWMVILSEADTLFVSPDEILAFLVSDEALTESDQLVDTRWIKIAPGPDA